MKFLTRHERPGHHPGWLTVNTIYRIDATTFTVNREDITPRESNPVPIGHDFTLVGGVLRWVSNGQIIPRDIVRDFDLHHTPGFDRDAHDRAYGAHLDAFLAEYRANQPASHSDEERVEARAAHDPGVTLVDVVTGRRWTT